jgi:hypothetical protein
LPAAEIGGEDAVLHRRENFRRVAVAREHISIGHARHRNVSVALAAAIAGRLHVHQSRVLPILHVADENAILDQHGLAGRCALVVDRQ